MKKLSFYITLFITGLVMSACGGSDYEPWADPQSNPQEDAITIPGFKASAVAAQDLNAIDADAVPAFTLSTATLPAGYSLTDARVELTPTGDDIKDATGTTLNATLDGTVTKAELQSLIEANYGKRPSARTYNAHVYVSAIKDGQAAFIDAGTVTFTVTPKAPKISKNYYIIGAPQGWSLTDKTYKFNHSDKDVYDDPIFTIVFPAATDGDTWFAIGDDAAMDAGDWSQLLGTTKGNGKNGVNVTEALDTRANIGNDASFVVPAGHKYIKVTLNMLDYTYLIETLDFGTEMYLAGNCNGWSQIDVLKGVGDGHYTGYMYLDQGGFKFCTQQDWNGTNYGEGFSTDGGAGNITMSEAPGYYKVDLDLVGMSYTLTAINTIGVIGDATVGGWDSDQDMTYDQANRCWTIDNIELTGGKTIKFRANDGWDINWGGDASALTQGGANIDIAESGTYSIKLYAWADGVAKCEITKK